MSVYPHLGFQVPSVSHHLNIIDVSSKRRNCWIFNSSARTSWPCGQVCASIFSPLYHILPQATLARYQAQGPSSKSTLQLVARGQMMQTLFDCLGDAPVYLGWEARTGRLSV